MDPQQKPPDDACMIDVPITEQQEKGIQDPHRIKPVQTFREAVAQSSQWFSEAKKIITTSMKWGEHEEIPPQEDMTVQFSQITLERLRSPWKLTLMENV